MDMDLQNIETAAAAEPEALTPLRYSTTFQIAEDLNDDSIVQKIPHGLTAKKNRRKSFQHLQSNAAFSLTPQRIPLTAPRPNVLNSHPMGFSPINQTKRSLMNELKSIKAGKENSLTPSFPSSNVDLGIELPQTSDFFIDTPSSPERLQNKRRSVTDEDDQVIVKHQKVDEATRNEDIQAESTAGLFSEAEPEHNTSVVESNDKFTRAGDDDGDADSSVDSDVEPEEFSRIEPFNSEANISKSKQEETVLNIQATAPITPSRMTEPVAKSPKTEQCSRVVDESGLLLDTSKPPLVDDSYRAPESPLSQHQTSIIEPSTKNVLENLDEIDDIPSEPSYQPLRESPKARALFTIHQLHEYQEDFKKAESALRDNLKEKHGEVKELNEQVAAYKNKVIEVKEEIDVLKLQKLQADKENELINTALEASRNDVIELEQSARVSEDKVNRYKTVINKFKDRLREKEQIIASNQKELGELEELKALLESGLKSRSDQYEKQIHYLSYNVEIAQREREELVQKNESLAQQLQYLNGELQTIRLDKDQAKKSAATITQELQDKDEQIKSLSESIDLQANKIQAFENEQHAFLTNTQALNGEVNELKNTLEAKVIAFNELTSKLEQSSKKLNLTESINAGINGALDTLKRELIDLRASNSQLSTHFSSAQNNLAEANENLTIRKAEVEELQIELKQAKDELSNLRALASDKNDHISQLNEIVNESSKALDAKDSKLKGIEQTLEKQESEHLAELETFHHELTNLQSSLTSKSNELYRVKEERDHLQRENDKTRYELSTIREEYSDADVRISNLKLKLNELRELNNDLEGQIQDLRSEKANITSETDKRLQQLAEDLYIQYSKKHEQKVQVLKKNYETKWYQKLSKAETENDRLRGDIGGLKAQLEAERAEKDEVLKLWDQLRQEQSTD